MGSMWGTVCRTLSSVPNPLNISGSSLHALALFMLVWALIGLDRMQAAYAHAIESGYRFYSYGDASLLLP